MDKLKELLCGYGVAPTRQRLQIARVLFERADHLCADEVYRRVNGDGARVSKATVYNTLGLFVERGLVHEVLVDSSKVFYDSNTQPHHHFYDTASGELTDIPSDAVTIAAVPRVPDGSVLDSVDVVIRIRPG